MPNDVVGLDTGDPGFDVGGDEHTYDVGDPDGQQVPSPGKKRNKTVNAEDGFTTDGKQKDLSKGTLLTLSQYMSDLTTGAAGGAIRKNDFPIDRGTDLNKVAVENKGYPTSQAPSTNTSQFAVEVNNPTVGSGVSTYSNSFPTISSLIKKGAVSSNAINGNELLKTVVESPDYGAEAGVPNFKDLSDSSPIKKYVSDVLKHNRFNPDFRRIDDVNIPNEYDHQIVNAASLGKNSLSLLDSVPVPHNKMNLLGASLSARASDERGSLDNGFNPNSPSAAGLSLLPGNEQLAISKIDVVNLDPLTALNSLANDITDNDVALFNINDKSWGSLNNVNDPFSGISALGMNVLSFTLFLAVVTGLEVFAFLVNLGEKGVTANKVDKVTGLYFKGESYQTETDSVAGAIGNSIVKQLGIQPVSSPDGFFKCVTRGIAATYGVDENNIGDFGSSVNVLNNFLNPFNTSAAGLDEGRNVVFSRAIIRSLLNISDLFKGIGSGPGGFLGAAEKVLNIVQVIARSKVVSALNMFAQIGDSRAASKDPWYPLTKGGSIDAIPNGINGFAVIKSRLNSSSDINNSYPVPKLAWGADTNRSKYIAPPGGVADANDYIATGSAPNNRISTDDVKDLEAQLEADYVPFYFHDIRTNEIVSFHAFLNNISDGYSAGYDSIEAFGRSEAIKHYRSTQRKIGLSFMIVSTGPSSFDEMYKKINKLTTLMYPQYTRGKQITDGNTTFTQPFSQLPGASPLIRLRIGDLISSNFANESLRRLFGAQDTLKVKGTSINSPTRYKKDILADRRSVFRLKAGISKSNIQHVTPDVDSLSIFYITTYPRVFVAYDRFKNDDGRYVYKIRAITANDILNEQRSSDEGLSTLRNVLPDDIDNAIKYSYIIDDDVLDFDTPQNTAGSYSSEADKFFNKDSNAIVRYFEETGGKGLPGFIESMDFDWNNMPWSIDQGSRAPKMCKVTLSFSPVHDITPGIDHLGYNRAAVYRLGPFRRKG